MAPTLLWVLSLGTLPSCHSEELSQVLSLAMEGEGEDNHYEICPECST